MPEFKTAHLPQGPVEYVEHGAGRPLLFVHGLLVDNRLWQPLLPHLGDGVRSIMPNWPLGAHGLAMKPDATLSVQGMVQLIADFIDALELHEVILVGNDTGGALVQMVCARFPQRIAGMVLTTCDAYDVFPPAAFTYLKWMGHVPGLAWCACHLLHHVPLLRQLPIAFGDLTEGPLPSELIEHWLRPMLCDAGVRRDVRKFLRTLSSSDTEKAGVALQRFAQPVLLLWSTGCRYFPRRLAERMQRELPDVELQWVEGASLFLSLDHAPLVGSSIRRFATQGAAVQNGRTTAKEYACLITPPPAPSTSTS